MSTKTMKEKATELLQRCEVVVLASINKEGYPRPVPMSKIAAEGISTILDVYRSGLIKDYRLS